MLARKRGAVVLLSVALGIAAGGKVVAAEQPIHHVSSEVCKTCHQDIYRQWKGSMHAQSSALSDPIHGTFYKNVVGDPTAEGVKHKASGKYPVCLQCHAPNAARDKVTKLDSNVAYSEGVNCVACHTLQTYKGIDAPNGTLQLGIKAYELSEQVQGPEGFNRGAEKLSAAGDMFGGATASADQKPNPHLGEPVTVDGTEIPALPMQGNPKLMKTSDACMGCHDKRNNPHGVPLCQTGNEYEFSSAKVACGSCHMPISEGLANHGMGGGHDLAMLKRSVVFAMEAENQGDAVQATVTLKNLNPHSLPTGAPFRNMYLRVVAYDENGDVVWENFKQHPAKEDPQAYLVYELSDDAGKPASPPVATKLGKDSRLKPHEERTLVYKIPASGVVLVRGELYYNLLWKGLADKFKHLPQELRDPVLVAVAENGV